MSPPKAPFPYTGGKSMIADTVWKALGGVTTYVEPFAGSCAVLLARPQPFTGLEIINDANGYVANCWRAIQQHTAQVADHANWPPNENDLHARHRWLWERRDQLQAQLESDPDWCDIKIAGWWLWGMANFFTGAFCVRERPNRCKLLCDSNRGITGTTSDPHQWMQELQDRMRRVKVLCGDFKRALTPSVVNPNGGNSGVFLDPPYDGGDTRVYGLDSASIFQETLDWALANASPTVRVVLAGYDSRPMPEGWREPAWKGHGGHGRRKDNKENTNQDRERLWLSPSCLNPDSESQVTSLDELLGM